METVGRKESKRQEGGKVTGRPLIIRGERGAKIGFIKGGSDYIVISIRAIGSTKQTDKIKRIKSLVCELFDVKPEGNYRLSTFDHDKIGLQRNKSDEKELD